MSNDIDPWFSRETEYKKKLREEREKKEKEKVKEQEEFWDRQMKRKPWYVSKKDWEAKYKKKYKW